MKVYKPPHALKFDFQNRKRMVASTMKVGICSSVGTVYQSCSCYSQGVGEDILKPLSSAL